MRDASPAIPLSVLVDAIAALRAIKDSPYDTVPNHLWTQCMRAHAQLTGHVERMQVNAPVELAE